MSSLTSKRCCLLLVCLFVALPTHAGDRVALVIGNAVYLEKPLTNPVNDARALSARLSGLGFDVVEVFDADLATMQQSLLTFVEKIGNHSTALVFYAGHGIQANGRNYLLPVDTRVTSERALRFEAMEMTDVLEELEAAGAWINIVILDACRNNPFERKMRGGSRGLAAVDAAAGTLIAYATAPGSVASDGAGTNGLYTQELLAALDVPGLKVEEVFKQVRREVSALSNGAQVPWESSSLTADFVFNTASPPATEPVASAQVPQIATGHADREALLWRSIEAGGTAADFEDYLDRYPDGAFARVAKRRLAALTGSDRDCSDLSGRWVITLGDATCADVMEATRTGDHLYDIQYSLCGALGTRSSFGGVGEFSDQVLRFKWSAPPCSGITEYTLDEACRAGTGRVVKRGGLPGVCHVFVKKNIEVQVRRDAVSPDAASSGG